MDAKITFRLPSKTKKTLKVKASSRGMTLSEYVRKLVTVFADEYDNLARLRKLERCVKKFIADHPNADLVGELEKEGVELR